MGFVDDEKVVGVEVARRVRRQLVAPREKNKKKTVI
jgi:hypothetical protein